MADAIQSFFKSQQKLSTRYTSNVVKNIWKEQMGPTIFSYTKRVQFSKGTLRIYLTSSTLRQELSMSKQKIAELMNAKLGTDMVREVIIT
ncbi:MAG TPA: DUF721 domain-containing protein [Saprospiraceae bacterium]|nr:DUF721 domain-containing protein [Saprospiraceae bacterium]